MQDLESYKCTSSITLKKSEIESTRTEFATTELLEALFKRIRDSSLLSIHPSNENHQSERLAYFLIYNTYKVVAHLLCCERHTLVGVV